MKTMSKMATLAGLALALPQALSASQADATKELTLNLVPTDEQREQGVHGDIELHGDFTENLRFANLVVVKSTGSAELDAWYLERLKGAGVASTEANQRFNRVEIKLSLQNVEYDDGIRINYPCLQAVRDADWAKANVSDWKVENEFLYRGVHGLFYMILADDADAFRAFAHEDFAELWLATIEQCRTTPETQFTDKLAETRRARREAADD